MAKIKLKFVQSFTDRHGQARHYFRRHGKQTALPGRPGSKEFMEAYARLLEGAPDRPKPKLVEGSFADLIVRYYASPAYTRLRPITQKNYRNVIERLRSYKTPKGLVFADLPVRGIEREHIEKIIDDMAPTPGAGYSLRRIFKILMGAALAAKLRTDDPTVGIKAPKGSKNGPGIRPLNQDDIAKLRETYALGTKPRLAFELLYNTAGRRTDVVALGRRHIIADEFVFTSSKTGVTVTVPVLPTTRAAIDAMALQGFDTLLVTEYGKPFTPAGFTNWFRDKCQDAGLPDASSPHGVRKAVLTELADKGVSAQQLMAVAGHLTWQEAERYTREADRRRGSRAAMGTIREQQVSNPVLRFDTPARK